MNYFILQGKAYLWLHCFFFTAEELGSNLRVFVFVVLTEVETDLVQPPVLLYVFICFHCSIRIEEDLEKFPFGISKTGTIRSYSVRKARSSYYEGVFICLPLSQHGIL